MQDTLFDTREKREDAIAKLTQLQNDPGWDLVCRVLEANIEIVKDLLLHGSDHEDMQMVKTYRERLMAYENLLRTPTKLIDQLRSEPTKEPSVDPFYSIDEVQSLRRAQS